LALLPLFLLAGPFGVFAILLPSAPFWRSQSGFAKWLRRFAAIRCSSGPCNTLLDSQTNILSPPMRLFLTKVRFSVTNANVAHLQGRRPGDSVRRGECGSRGRRLVTGALGRLGQDTPGRHHDRTAGAISLDWDSKARVTPASDAWKPAVGFASCVARRSVFRTIGAGAPSYSQEVAWLELSGGVRSLPQVPWWNAERRAAPEGAAPCP
jgi:hypothetical protein